MNTIEIWEPRWKDRKVLVAKYRVANENIIIFTKAKSLPGKYYVTGELLRACPVETNGKIACYALPIDLMERKD